jgi:hypothetical protein
VTREAYSREVISFGFWLATTAYWVDGPKSEQPPGHWHLFAGAISRKHSQTIHQDAKLNFAVSNALLDAGITSRNAKRRYDFIRPVTAVCTTQAGKTIKAWAGPGQGTRVIPAEQFRSYIPTPPFPDYVSGHSTFSAAAAQVLRSFTGSDTLNLTVNFAAGSSFWNPAPSPPPRSRWAGRPTPRPRVRLGCRASTAGSISATPTPTASTWGVRWVPTPGTGPKPTSKVSPPAEQPPASGHQMGPAARSRASRTKRSWW